MKPLRTLVVFSSRTGQTKHLARMIADAANADLDELIDERDRPGIRGFLKSGLDAVFHRMAPLPRGLKDPAEYDLVFVGSPARGENLTAAVRTFLSWNSGRLPKVAFFVHTSAHGADRVVNQMTRLACREPIARIIVSDGEILSPSLAIRIRAFVRFALPSSRDEQAHAVSPPGRKIDADGARSGFKSAPDAPQEPS
jgi:hypothetical protein